MRNDLISRASLQASIETARREKYKQYQRLMPGDVERLIMVEPTVENAAPVVRCKDCAHVSEALSVAGSNWCKCLNLLMDDQFYCAYGRRKGELIYENSCNDS